MNLLVCLLYPNRATLQRPGSRSFDLHFHKIAGLNAIFLLGLREEDQFIGAIAALPLPTAMTDVIFLNQHLFKFAKILLVELTRNGRLKFLDSMESALFLGQRNIVIPACSHGAGTHGVGSDVDD